VNVELTEAEAGLIAAMVRSAIRKAEKNQRNGEAKFGKDWDPTGGEARIALLEGLYRKVGKTPGSITNRRTAARSLRIYDEARQRVVAASPSHLTVWIGVPGPAHGVLLAGPLPLDPRPKDEEDLWQVYEEWMAAGEPK
jgi:hypothetical protein